MPIGKDDEVSRHEAKKQRLCGMGKALPKICGSLDSARECCLVDCADVLSILRVLGGVPSSVGGIKSELS